MKQKFDPFKEPNRTYCGDCGKLLTDGDKRLDDVFIEDGIRCRKCYEKYKEMRKGRGETVLEDLLCLQLASLNGQALRVESSFASQPHQNGAGKAS